MELTDNEHERTPRSAHRRVRATEAILLLKDSPINPNDFTPPSRNTRSRRQATSPTNKSPVSSKKQPPKRGAKKGTGTNTIKQKERDNADKGRDEIIGGTGLGIKEEVEDIEEGHDEVGAPTSPQLDLDALLSSPFVNSKGRDRVRREYLEIKKREHLEECRVYSYAKGVDVDFCADTLESTKIRPIAPLPNSPRRAPVRWDLDKVSPIRTEAFTIQTVEGTKEEEFELKDVSVQASLCRNCNSHKPLREMKPIIMVFVLMLISSLYRGLLKVDPRFVPDFRDGLGLMVQGSFLSSFALEEYVGDFFQI